MENSKERITITDRSLLIGEGAKYRNYNLFIEAGAGAGKTDTVIKKVIDQLSQGIEPSRFVVITFTNKATEELMSRIYKGIIEKRNNIDDPKLKSILDNAISKLYKMTISTIHSFCNSLLNANSFKAGLSYGANLIEEEEEQERENYIYNKWIRTLSPIEINQIASLNCEKPFKILRSTYKALCISFDDVVPITDTDLPYLEILKLLDEYTKEIKYYGSYPLNATGDIYLNLADKLFMLGNSLPAIEKAIKENNDNLLLFKETFNAAKKAIRFSSSKIKDQAIKEAINQANEEIANIKEKIKTFEGAIKIADALPGYHLINEFAVKAWNYYKEHRDRENLCNNQLIYEAYALLDNEEISKQIANKYDVIYIDEFQDTDRCQIAFLLKLARAIDDRKEKEGKQTTSLIVVGDPKQSIYRFRGADFDSYLSTQKRFVTFGENNKENNYVSLFFPDNYRSNNLIINFVNKVYANNVDGSSKFYPGYSYEPMTYRRVVPNNTFDKTLAGVYTYNFKSNPDDKIHKFSRLSKFIKYLCDPINGYKLALPSIDNKQGCEIRQIRPSDFLVLTTSHTQMSKYVEAFNKEGIKCLIAGEFDLAFTNVIRYIYVLLSYIYNKDENNFLNLSRLLESQGINDIHTYLDKLENKIFNLSPFGKFAYILNNFELVLPNFTVNDENIIQATIKQLYELLALKVNSSNVEILLELEKVLNEVQKSQIVLSKDDDCVSIMNVHQSKGLEGNIVVVADSGSLNNKMSSLTVGNKIYLNNKEVNPTAKKFVETSARQEKVRLEYVAMTRAKHMIIFENDYNNSSLFGRTNNDDTFGYDFLTLITKDDHLSDLPSEEDVFISKDEMETKYFDVKLSSNKAIDDALKVKKNIELTPSSLEVNCPVEIDPSFKPRRPSSNIFGNCLHKMMELYVKNTSIKKDKLINQVIFENKDDINQMDISMYKSSLKECLNVVEKLYQENHILEGAISIEPEFKFIEIDDDIIKGNETLLNGSIDLLIIKNEKAIIIDYKSDIASYKNKAQFEELLKRSYSKQILTYKKMVEKQLQIKNVETFIVWIEELKTNSVAHLLPIVDGTI